MNRISGLGVRSGTLVTAEKLNFSALEAPFRRSFGRWPSPWHPPFKVDRSALPDFPAVSVLMRYLSGNSLQFFTDPLKILGNSS